MLKSLVRRICPSGVFMAFLFGIVGGIIVSAWLKVSFFSSIYWVVFVVLAFGFAIWRPNYLFVAIMLIIGAILGSFRVSGELSDQAKLNQLVGKNISISGVVTGDPDFEEENGKVKLSSLSYNGENIHGMIYLSGKLDHNIRRDDRLTISGKLESGFGGFVGSFYQPKIESLNRATNPNFLLEFRDSFSDSVKALFGESEREANLGLSYLLGLRTGLDKELVEMLSLVGLTHIVVASGTHLGILVEVFRRLFGKISRFSGMYFGIIFILLFGEMIGWTASITRAAIVAILGILGWYVGRKFEGWRIILVAMAITLMINPMNMVDLGWLLSFGSFFGIMVLAPGSVRFFYGQQVGGRYVSGEKPNMVAEIIVATISATLMCAPILLYYFGSISLISILANLLILPTIPIAMGLMFLSGLVGYIPNGFGFLKMAVVKITTLLLDYHILVIEFCSKQTGFLVQIPKGDFRVFLLYIPILLPFIVGNLVRARKTRKQIKRIQAHPEKYLRLTVKKPRRKSTRSVKT